jgi:UDP-2-acetamido-3-amino-2,3-dideoxy-glucuronate N-acetyltransferase
VSDLNLTASKRMRLAVMGIGRWGRNVARAFNSLDNVDVVWAVDPCQEACRLAEEIIPGVKTASNINVALDDVGQIAVCTPARDHVTHVHEALKAGKNVFVEKPFAMNFHDAQVLNDECHARSSTLMVGHQLLFHPLFRRLQKKVAEGGLGKVASCQSVRTGTVDYPRETGVIWEYGPHDVGMILELAGEYPSTVRASGTVHRDYPDLIETAQIHLNFSSGLEAKIILESTNELRQRELRVTGERASAVFDDTVAPGLLTIDDVEVDAVRNEPLLLECAHFTDCILGAKSVIGGPQHATQVTQILEAAEKCIFQKK